MTAVSNVTSFDTAVEVLQAKLTPEAMEQVRGVYAFHFTDLGVTHTLDAHDANGRGWLLGEPAMYQLRADFEVTISSGDFANLVAGRLHPMAGMATGRMKLQGSIKEALKLDRLLKS
jgi:hypothetical protein